MTSNPLDEARRLSAQVQRLEGKIEPIRRQRDRAIFEAAQAGLSPLSIGQAIGLSRSAIRNVIRDETARRQAEIIERITAINDEERGNTDTQARQRLTEERNSLNEERALLARRTQ